MMSTRGLYALAVCAVAGLVAVVASCGGKERPTEPVAPAAHRPTLAIDPAAPILVGAGEIARCDGTGDEATAALLDTISGTVVALGDNAYTGGSSSDYTNCYDPGWGRQKARTRPTPGDVDYTTSGAPGYFGYFGTAAGDPTKGYYSYDIGSWHIIVLNSTIGKDTGSTQNDWLRADLAANNKSCTLAYWHHPLFWSGVTSSNRPTIKPLWDALYEYRVDVVLNAHNRNYERFMPQTPDGVADSLHGIREFIVGTGGYDLGSAFGTPLPTSEVRDRSAFGVLALTLNSNSYHWQFVPQAGATFSDTGTTTCHGAPPVSNHPPVANAGGPYAGVEGTPVQFDGSASSDVDGDALTYAWTFGDGTTGTGVKPTHAYPDNKTYTVSLVVTDVSGAQSKTVQTSAVIANAAPVVAPLATPSPAPRAKSAATFSTTFTDPGILDKHTGTFTWGDGGTNSATITESSGAGTAAASHTYAAAGTYNVSLRVVDNNGAADTVKLSVVVGAQNHPPVANAGGPYTGVEGTPVAFDGSASSDPDGDAITYDWDFGDGTPHDTGVAPAHTYANNAKYTVKLIVTDSYKAKSTTAQTTATIANAAPVVTSITGPTSPVPGTALTVSASFMDPGTKDTHSGTFTWGDGKSSTGTISESGGKGTVTGTHTYAAKGTYTVSLRLADNNGAADTATLVLAVGVPQTVPTASAGGPYTATEGQAVTFDGSGSTSPSGSSLTYAWTFGDGTTGTGVRPTHGYAKIGSYTITLIVTDASGLTSQPAQSIASIANAAPVVNAGLDTTVIVGGAKQLAATFSDAGASDGPWRYDINWGDGSAVAAGTQSSQPGPIAATHGYAAPGTYTVHVSVTDAYGATGADDEIVTVLSSPVMFSYRIGGSEAGFTTTGRTSSAWYHDAGGVLRVAGAGAIRDNAYVRSTDGVWRQVVLLEGQSTNLFTQSEPTVAQLASASAGVTDGTTGAFAAYGFANTQGLHFAAAAQADNAYPAATIATATQYSISAYVIMDDGSAPVVGGSATTGDFSLVVDNAIVAANLRVYSVVGPLYRVSGTYTSVGTGAGGIARAATQSGRGFSVVGFDIENLPNATSYIQTVGAPYTRALDQFHSPITFNPQVLTLCASFVELGAAYESGTFIQIGSRLSTQNPRMILLGNKSSPYRVKYADPSGVGSAVGFPSPMPKVGDVVELRGVVRLVNGAPVAYIGESVNGGLETVSAYSSGDQSLGAAWTEYLIDWTAGAAREKGLLSTSVLAGEASLAGCRSALP